MSSQSRILDSPLDENGDAIDGAFSVNFNDDGQITGIVQHGASVNTITGSRTAALDPSSETFKKLLNSDEVMTVRNVAVYGSKVDSYDDKPDDGAPTVTTEELENNFAELKKKFDNEDQLAFENAAKDQEIAANIQNYANNSYSRGSRNTLTNTLNSEGDKRPSKPVFAYPLDIDIEQDHMKITRYEYFRPPANDQRREMFARKTSGPGGADLLQYSKLDGSIILPMPKVVDANAAEWGDSKINIVGLAAGELAAGLGLGEIGSKRFANFNAEKASKQLQKDARKALDKEFNTEGAKKGTRNEAVQLLMATTVESVATAAGANITQNEFLARSSGRVLNPNAELLFSGPVLRDFNFDFTMIARGRREGDEIRQIIRFLKIGMAPVYAKDGFSPFLSTPRIFKLEYKRGDRPLNTVNRFNPSGLALRSVQVDYAPNGYWSAYQDSQPVAVRMTLNFAELKPIFDVDQIESPESSVGY